MASIKLMTTKNGKQFYKIAVSRGYGNSPYTKRWYVPEGWSDRSIQRELRKVVAEFERACTAGEVLTRADQKRIAAAAEAEAAKNMTVKRYIDEMFMPAKKVTLAATTISSYKMFFRSYIEPAFGEDLLTEVRPAAIGKLLSDMQGKGLAYRTVIKCYNVLKGMFRTAYMTDCIAVNPMDKVSRPRPRKDETLQEGAKAAMTASELSYVLKCVSQEPLFWQVYINLAADTGARRGEICGLQWSDIDWSNSTVTIQRNLQYTPEDGVYSTTTKSGKNRVIDIGPETLSLLKQFHSEQTTLSLDRWIFNKEGSSAPMSPQRATQYFRTFGERYGIKGFHPHLLRHTSASIALTNGGDVVSVSERLGHASPAVTLSVYSHSNQEAIRRAGQSVRDAIEKVSGK